MTHASRTDARRLVRAVTAVAAALLVLLALPHGARAGYGVQPNGQTFAVTANSIGTVATPATLDFVVYLDDLDRDGTQLVMVFDQKGRRTNTYRVYRVKVIPR